MTHTLQLAIQCDAAAGALPVERAQLRRWVLATLQSPAAFTFRFVGEAEGRALNLEYRQKDYATNVLTFPFVAPVGVPGADTVCMADIAICLPVVAREAAEQGKALRDHLAHLVVHGCLHAQGHDHDTDEQARLMESLETRLLKRFRIADPYLLRMA
ncbi:MAG: rRNA maturation RNase YbeY [Burkholderiaceae bacterium]|jgi:probable rRNA maturation factor